MGIGCKENLGKQTCKIVLATMLQGECLVLAEDLLTDTYSGSTIFWPVYDYFQRAAVACIHHYGASGTYKIREELYTTAVLAVNKHLTSSC
jgi:hypothetical protein